MKITQEIIAQLGSNGVVDGQEFSKRFREKTIRRLLPKLFRELFPHDSKLLAAADRCEAEGTVEAAWAAAWDAGADAAADAHYAAVDAAYATYAADAAYAAEWIAGAAGNPEEYLLLSAELALETLKELGSPGV